MISIRQRLTRSLLLVLTVLFGAGLASICLLVRDELIEGFDRALVSDAEALSALVHFEQGQVMLNLSEKLTADFAESGEYVELWGEDGALLQHSPSLGETRLIDRIKDFKRRRPRPMVFPDGQRGRALVMPVTIEEREADAVSSRGHESRSARLRLVVAERTRELDNDVNEVLSITGIGAILLITLTALIVPWVVRRGLSSLEQLAAETEKINAETLTLRFPSQGQPRELRAITDRLNALLFRLEHSFERERRVSAAMAHELRTPIAELRNLAECALKWPEVRDPEMDRDALAIARQMEAIVTHLLTLSRSETGQLTPNLESLDLSQAIAQAWKPFGAQANSRNCSVSFAVAPVIILADPVLLRSILGNLFENAVEYCPAGGAIVVGSSETSDGISLSITNPAPDLSEEDVSRLFERFWRKEKARSGGRHAGLGLSITRAFTHVLGAEITPHLDSAGMLTLTVSGLKSQDPVATVPLKR